MPKLGTPVDRKSGMIVETAPVVFAVQPEFYVKLESPGEVKQWENDVRDFFGVNLRGENLVGVASESCSGGCSDDCDLI